MAWRKPAQQKRLDVFLSEAWLHARDATDSTDAFCGFVVERLVALHGPGGRIDGSRYKKGTSLPSFRMAVTGGGRCAARGTDALARRPPSGRRGSGSRMCSVNRLAPCLPPPVAAIRTRALGLWVPRGEFITDSYFIIAGARVKVTARPVALAWLTTEEHSTEAGEVADVGMWRMSITTSSRAPWKWRSPLRLIA
ncbi:hypothetical protein NFJ02_14g18220 [Pycnococcus provasolii]